MLKLQCYQTQNINALSPLLSNTHTNAHIPLLSKIH